VTTLSYTLDFGDLGASGGGGRAVVACDGHAPLEQGYFADVGRIDGVFGMSLPDAAADLVAIAVAVHVADRAAPRRRHDRADPYGLGWRRHLHLRVPVRDPRRWGGASLLQGLQATLEYFTDDAWSFDFVGLAADEAPRQGYLFPHRPPNPAVALFSGGLDALIGAADLLASDARPTLIALSAGTNRRTIGRQRELVAALGGRPGRGIRHVEVPCNLRATDVAEPTQRARGFVFLALAAAVAEQAGCATIALCENGIGALSLPYNRTQVGAHTTRAAHPLALDRMGRFLGAALGRPIRIRNPYLFETKGQMCARLAGLGIADLAARSVSCDTFASRRARCPATPSRRGGTGQVPTAAYAPRASCGAWGCTRPASRRSTRGAGTRTTSRTPAGMPPSNSSSPSSRCSISSGNCAAASGQRPPGRGSRRPTRSSRRSAAPSSPSRIPGTGMSPRRWSACSAPTRTSGTPSRSPPAPAWWAERRDGAGPAQKEQ